MGPPRSEFLKTEYIPYMALVFLLTVSSFFFKIEKLNQPEIPSQQTTSVNRPSGDEGEFKPWQAPDFTLEDLNGVKVSLSDYRGKIVFLNIWATWCKPCEVEMPAMEKLYKKFQDQNFEMLTISIDTEGKQVIEPYIKKWNLTFPVLLDPESKIVQKFNITGVPETFLIDTQGVVFQHVVGPREWDHQLVYHFFEKILELTV